MVFSLANQTPGLPARSASRAALMPFYRLSGVIALLAFIAAAGGLFVPGLYRENGYMLPQAQGNDLVTLVFALPLFVGSLLFAVRGSLRAQVIWLGVLGYLLYTYITFALDAVFNPFFLLYVAILGLCVFTAVGGLSRVDAERLRRHFAGEKTARAMAVYCLALALLVFLMWMGQLLPSLLANRVPESLELAGTPTNFVWALDLGILIPFLALTGGWLWRRQSPGYLLAGVVLVKGLTLGLAILGMAFVMWLNAQPVDPGVLVIALVFVVAALPFLALYLPRIKAEPQRAAVAPATRTRSIPRWSFLLPAAIVPLLLLVTLAGLLVPGLYRDNGWVVPQSQTQDLFILAVALPLFVAALVGAARGSQRALLVLLGCLAYFLYGYIHYAFGIRHNQLFLAYVGLMGLSLYSLIALFSHLDAGSIKASLETHVPENPAAIFLWVAGGLVFLAWLADVVLSLLAGTVPETVRLAGTPTSVTYALDMGVLVPACYVAALWLWSRRAMGYLLAAMLLVMTTLIDLVGVPLSLVMGAPGPAAVMGVLAAAGLVVTVAFLRGFGEGRGSSFWV